MLKKSLISGKYINLETKMIEWRRYFFQISAWCIIVIIAKIISFSVQLLFKIPLNSLGNAIFSSISDPNMELVLVLVIIPLILDIFQVK